MHRVVHFEIAADDPERAAGFYSAVFGWQVSKYEGAESYWLVKTGEDDAPGINGGLMARPDPSAPGVVNTVDVASVDDAVADVERNGGRLMVPKMAVPGMGWVAYCADTEGNAFGVFQGDPSAA